METIGALTPVPLCVLKNRYAIAMVGSRQPVAGKRKVVRPNIARRVIACIIGGTTVPGYSHGFGQRRSCQMENKPDYLEHRKRLREKFLKAGAAGLHDYESLELLLTYAI